MFPTFTKIWRKLTTNQYYLYNLLIPYIIIPAAGLYLGLIINSFFQSFLLGHYSLLIVVIVFGPVLIPKSYSTFLIIFVAYRLLFDRKGEYSYWTIFFISFFGFVIGGQIIQSLTYVLRVENILEMPVWIPLELWIGLGLILTLGLFYLLKKVTENSSHLKKFIIVTSLVLVFNVLLGNYLVLSSLDLCNKISEGMSYEEVVDVVSVYTERDSFTLDEEYYYTIIEQRTEEISKEWWGNIIKTEEGKITLPDYLISQKESIYVEENGDDMQVVYKKRIITYSPGTSCTIIFDNDKVSYIGFWEDTI